VTPAVMEELVKVEMVEVPVDNVPPVSCMEDAFWVPEETRLLARCFPFCAANSK